jgi:hypothetical protein
MRKAIVVAIAIALVGAAAQAQTNQVLSRNAVGYAKVTAAKGSLSMLRNDFNSLSGPATPSNLFGNTTFPIGTTLYLWDGFASAYTLEVLASNKASGINWSPNTNRFTPGRGFWLQIPGTAPSNSYTAFLMGEVPDRFTAPTTTIAVATSLNMLGYPYPAQVKWTGTVLAVQSGIGDTLYSWNGAQYSLNVLSSSKASGIRWSDTNQVLEIAKGYWYQRNAGAGFNWAEPKPYTWP